MNSIKNNPIALWLESIHSPADPNSKKTFLFTFISVVALILTYSWCISFGRWTSWPTPASYYYYDQLATAFQHGQLSLEKKPDPALLALPNPYDPDARAGLDYPTDVSLYHGKYYLYFGPGPALLLMIVKCLFSGGITDQVPVFAFVCGAGIFQSLLIIKIRGRFFRDVPIWMTAPAILFSGLVAPWTWILTQARVYEAASAGGQFFFLGGFYFAITAVNHESVSVRRLLVAGAAWALALGSRITQILPVGFAIGMIVYLVFRTYHQKKAFSNLIYPLTALGLPLAMGLAALGWYNWARFNSIFETGFSYQLAGPYIQKYKNILFSPAYILPDLYNYMLMPPAFKLSFPFL